VEEGIEQYFILHTAIKGPEFADFLTNLRKKNGKRPLAILMDQLSVHSDKNHVAHLYQELDIK